MNERERKIIQIVLENPDLIDRFERLVSLLEMHPVSLLAYATGEE